jgi:hypothetical protein
MIVRHHQNNSPQCLGLLLIFLLMLPAFAAVPPDSDPVSGTDRLENSKTVQQGVPPDPGSNPPVEKILSELSDDQVRRLLIEALRQQSRPPAAAAAEDKKLGGLASLIKKIRFMGDTTPWRIYALRSGFEAEPDKLPLFFRLLAKGEAPKDVSPFRAITTREDGDLKRCNLFRRLYCQGACGGYFRQILSAMQHTAASAQSFSFRA